MCKWVSAAFPISVSINMLLSHRVFDAGLRKALVITQTLRCRKGVHCCRLTEWRIVRTLGPEILKESVSLLQQRRVLAQQHSETVDARSQWLPRVAPCQYLWPLHAAWLCFTASGRPASRPLWHLNRASTWAARRCRVVLWPPAMCPPSSTRCLLVLVCRPTSR